jgi:hypothetical protein
MLLRFLIRQADRKIEQATRGIKHRKRRRKGCSTNIYTIWLVLLKIRRVKKINDAGDYKRL